MISSDELAEIDAAIDASDDEKLLAGLNRWEDGATRLRRKGELEQFYCSSALRCLRRAYEARRNTRVILAVVRNVSEAVRSLQSRGNDSLFNLARKLFLDTCLKQLATETKGRSTSMHANSRAAMHVCHAWAQLAHDFLMDSRADVEQELLEGLLRSWPKLTCFSAQTLLRDAIQQLVGRPASQDGVAAALKQIKESLEPGALAYFSFAPPPLPSGFETLDLPAVAARCTAGGTETVEFDASKLHVSVGGLCVSADCDNEGGVGAVYPLASWPDVEALHFVTAPADAQEQQPRRWRISLTVEVDEQTARTSRPLASTLPPVCERPTTGPGKLRFIVEVQLPSQEALAHARRAIVAMRPELVGRGAAEGTRALTQQRKKGALEATHKCRAGPALFDCTGGGDNAEGSSSSSSSTGGAAPTSSYCATTPAGSCGAVAIRDPPHPAYVAVYLHLADNGALTRSRSRKAEQQEADGGGEGAGASTTATEHEAGGGGLGGTGGEESGHTQGRLPAELLMLTEAGEPEATVAVALAAISTDIGQHVPSSSTASSSSTLWSVLSRAPPPKASTSEGLVLSSCYPAAGGPEGACSEAGSPEEGGSRIPRGMEGMLDELPPLSQGALQLAQAQVVLPHGHVHAGAPSSPSLPGPPLSSTLLPIESQPGRPAFLSPHLVVGRKRLSVLTQLGEERAGSECGAVNAYASQSAELSSWAYSGEEAGPSPAFAFPSSPSPAFDDENGDSDTDERYHTGNGGAGAGAESPRRWQTREGQNAVKRVRLATTVPFHEQGSVTEVQVEGPSVSASLRDGASGSGRKASIPSAPSRAAVANALTALVRELKAAPTRPPVVLPDTQPPDFDDPRLARMNLLAPELVNHHHTSAANEPWRPVSTQATAAHTGFPSAFPFELSLGSSSLLLRAAGLGEEGGTGGDLMGRLQGALARLDALAKQHGVAAAGTAAAQLPALLAQCRDDLTCRLEGRRASAVEDIHRQLELLGRTVDTSSRDVQRAVGEAERVAHGRAAEARSSITEAMDGLLGAEARYDAAFEAVKALLEDRGAFGGEEVHRTVEREFVAKAKEIGDVLLGALARSTSKIDAAHRELVAELWKCRSSGAASAVD